LAEENKAKGAQKQKRTDVLYDYFVCCKKKKEKKEWRQF
jgi:hypothetical protein